MFGLMAMLVLAVFAVILVGMVGHMVAFGSILWLIVKRASQAADAQNPKPCAFCGGTLLPEASSCRACGAPRDPKDPAARSVPHDAAV